MTESRYVGRSIRRVEDERLVTGHGQYVGDMHPEGMLHARFVRSPIAHGIIREIDTTEALVWPGVVGVFTASDLEMADLAPEGLDAGMRRPMLARDRVRHVGEAVAVVIAESETAAFDAADAVWPDIDHLTPVVTIDQALTDTTLVHPDAGTNIAKRTQTSEDKPWTNDVVIDIDVFNQRVSAVPIEPLAGLAVPRENGIRLWATHQTPHRLRDDLVTVLSVPIDVTVPDVGGGFGLKGRFYPEFAVICAAARRLGRPVRWLQTRRESMSGGTHGRDIVHRVRLGGDSDGTFRRCAIELLGSVGAYPHTGTQVLDFSSLVAQQLYDFDELTVSSTSVVTNLAPTAAYRGAGRPEAAMAMERAVETFARKAGLDPIEMRRRNLMTPESFPYRTRTGAAYDSGDYRAAFEKAIRMADIEKVRSEQRHRIDVGEDPIGLGLGVFVERAGGPPTSAEYARTTIGLDGEITVHTGSTSNGQGHETVWAQVAAEVFDVEMSRITVIGGDTVVVPTGWGSTASRSAQIGASGVSRTAKRVLERARSLAGSLLEASPDDLVLSEGVFSVAGSPGPSIGLAAIAEKASADGSPLSDEELYSPGAQTFPFGVHVAVVQVSIETGEVGVLEIIAVDDCGNLLNPMIVEGQVHGSLAQGFGQAIMEAIRYDDQGQLLSATLMDYPIPHAGDMPAIRSAHTVSPAPSNPLGVKGSGESGCIGAPPAIVNAVLDALAPWGVTDLSMPLRPENVWSAIQKARG